MCNAIKLIKHFCGKCENNEFITTALNGLTSIDYLAESMSYKRKVNLELHPEFISSLMFNFEYKNLYYRFAPGLI